MPTSSLSGSGSLPRLFRSSSASQPPEAHEAAAEGEERLVDLGATVVADEQSLEVVQPGEGAFDDPAGTAEPRAVLGLAAGDLRDDRPTA
jgi:hypothetical protein